MSKPGHCAECGIDISHQNVKPTCQKGLCYFTHYDYLTNRWIRGADKDIGSDYGSIKWQQPMPTQYVSEPSYSDGMQSLGILAEILNAQHSRFVGIFSDLLNSFPPNIGAEEIMPEAAQTFATFAKLQENIKDLHTRATRAKNSCMNNQKSTEQLTGEFINKR